MSALVTTRQTIILFAYGSNMLTGRIRTRCPRAIPLGAAELRGYELRWHKRGRDESGKCDIRRMNDAPSVVHGVLYELPLGEKAVLDRVEGLGHGYDETNAEVLFKGGHLVAAMYQATDIDPSLKPYSWYKAFVVAGAKQHSLPREYVGQLVATDAVEDPNRERHDRNRQLLAASVSGPLS